MPVAIVSGSGGLVGSESVRRLVESGWEVVGLENDLRAEFFGPDASTAAVSNELAESYGEFRWLKTDIRDTAAVERAFSSEGARIELVVHTAAQPSHDWAARDPQTDFGVNANGTLNLLEATRRFSPEATFVFLSTNKVYGDTPNHLPLRELPKRWEIEPGHEYEPGISESMSIDHTKHSLFGASKAG